MSAVLAVALPVFAVIAAGLAAGRFGATSADDGAALNRFVFRIAMPAALFGLAAGVGDVDVRDLKPAAAYGLAAGVVILCVYALSRRAGAAPQAAGARALAASFGNAVFIGLPIALVVDGWSRPFVLMMLVEGLGVLSIGAALIAPRPQTATGSFGRALGGALIRALKNPLVAAMIAGLAWGGLATRLRLGFDGPVADVIAILGRAAGPTALFALGVFFATTRFPPVRDAGPAVALVVVAKMALLPALAYAFARLLGVAGDDALGPLMLFTLVPSAVGSFVIASAYDVETNAVAAAVATTTAVSLVTVSAVLAVFAP
ncbi:MAG: AEC family transporter [Parvularculaceae bacterium]